MIDATGVRITWADLPPHLRTQIEERLGSPVVEAVSQAGGFSPGTADRVVTAAGDRAFVKSVGTGLNPRSVVMARAEARITAALPPGTPAPRMIATLDDGDWVTLILEDVEGRNPRTPWTDDELDAAVAGLRELSRALTPVPVPDVPTAAETLGPDLTGWDRIAEDPPDDLEEWVVDNLPALRAASVRATRSLTGDTLCHCDIRADNMLVRPDGSMVFVDWPWGCAGPDWLDTVMFALNVIAYGGDERRVLAGADPAIVLDFVAGCTGAFRHQSRLAPPPGLPTVRAFQRAQSDALIPWLRTAMAVPKGGS